VGRWEEIAEGTGAGEKGGRWLPAAQFQTHTKLLYNSWLRVARSLVASLEPLWRNGESENRGEAGEQEA